MLSSVLAPFLLLVWLHTLVRCGCIFACFPRPFGSAGCVVATQGKRTILDPTTGESRTCGQACARSLDQKQQLTSATATATTAAPTTTATSTATAVAPTTSAATLTVTTAAPVAALHVEALHVKGGRAAAIQHAAAVADVSNTPVADAVFGIEVGLSVTGDIRHDGFVGVVKVRWAQHAQCWHWNVRTCVGMSSLGFVRTCWSPVVTWYLASTTCNTTCSYLHVFLLLRAPATMCSCCHVLLLPRVPSTTYPAPSIQRDPPPVGSITDIQGLQTTLGSPHTPITSTTTMITTTPPQPHTHAHIVFAHASLVTCTCGQTTLPALMPAGFCM
jgi:hypothetical protein